LEQNPQGGLYLGPNVNNIEADATATPPFYPPDDVTRIKIYGGLVGAAGQLPLAMLRVAPSNPKNSFLMHKIDGDQGCSGIACKPIATGECGEAMPQRNTPLESEAANTVRDWILQGALDD
jgi:hypothetical protein